MGRGIALAAASLAALGGPAARADEAAAMARHHLTVAPAAFRSTGEYELPRVRLLRADGRPVWLDEELNDGRPIVLDFVYTTCTSLCPMISQTFEALQDRLGEEREHVHFVSISIDPEQDTPRRLLEYSRRFDAGPQWQFYTGSAEASLQVQRAFHAFLGDKMSHPPLILVRAAPGRSWIRFDGFASVEDLLGGLREAALR